MTMKKLKKLSKQELALLDIAGRNGMSSETISDFRKHGNGETPYPCDPVAVNMIHAQGGMTSAAREQEEFYYAQSPEWHGWMSFIDAMGDNAWIPAYWYSLDIMLGWNNSYVAYRRNIAAQGWAPGPNPFGDRWGVLK
jgi:hypothetical protein